VPPIYQPEVAARAIVRASTHRRREIWVGYPTVGAIGATKVVPGLLDRYLARTNFEAQQTDQPVEPHRPDNLYAALPGDQGAHGIFDAEAKGSSLQLQLTLHRRLAAGAAASAAGVAALGSRRRRR